MLVSKTSAAAVPLTRFRGLARVPQKRACVPSLARVPGVAHPCYNLLKLVYNNSFCILLLFSTDPPSTSILSLILYCNTVPQKLSNIFKLRLFSLIFLFFL